MYTNRLVKYLLDKSGESFMHVPEIKCRRLRNVNEYLFKIRSPPLPTLTVFNSITEIAFEKFKATPLALYVSLYDCTFPIDQTPNGIIFDTKSIRKLYSIYLCI